MSYHNHPTVLGPVVGGSRGPTSAGRGGQRDEGGAGGLAEARGEKGGGYAEEHLLHQEADLLQEEGEVEQQQPPLFLHCIRS